MVKTRVHIGKILYGILFCVLLPLMLYVWATHIETFLPPIPLRWIGMLALIPGITLIIFAMLDLRTYGEGLPMNAFPPKHFVNKRTYTLFRHPIYVGFCICCAGVSILFESATGLYIVTPVVAMLCIALVMGYEQPDLIRRFGKLKYKTAFGLPDNLNEKASWAERWGTAFAVFIPWAILYELFIYVGSDEYYFDTIFPFERKWRVAQWSEAFYVLTYAFAGFAPLIIKSKSALRAFQLNSWWCTALGMFCYFIFPFFSSPRPFDPASWLGMMIILERSVDGSSAAFPSFHAIWALIATTCWSSAFPKFRMVVFLFGGLVIYSCVGTGNHSIMDVVFAILVTRIVFKRTAIWNYIQRRSEKLANAWGEVNIGNFRIINHSIYAGLAAAVGMLIAAQFSVRYEILLIVSFSSLIGGALWGQALEGSSKLLRPFGYYGALLGGLLGVALSSVIYGNSFLVLCSAFAVAAPWTQAVGRLRCLVQGCCHGSITETGGIRYVNPKSRVCKTPGLQGRSLHNTQLYSIIACVVIGLVLFRMRYAGSSPSFIAGMYFILGGIARFIEEAHRGEVQTKTISGLRLYQWFAIIAVFSGMIITMIDTDKLPVTPGIDLPLVITAIVSGLTWAFAMGMDFPKSTIRFSRLSG